MKRLVLALYAFAAVAACHHDEADRPIGIEECDKLIAAYRACAEKMPEAARGPATRGLEQMVTAWKRAAGGSNAAKDALRAGCRSVHDNSKQAMAAACPDVKWE
jgi:hypothetical protein